MKNIRLKDLPSFHQTTGYNNLAFDNTMEAALATHRASANIFHTFDELESDLVDVLSSMLPKVYAIGPQQLLLKNILSSSEEKYLPFSGYSLWEEESTCLHLLDAKKPKSVNSSKFWQRSGYAKRRADGVRLGAC